MVKPPSKVRVGPLVYSVVLDDAKVPVDHYGICDKDRTEIHLDPDQSEIRLRLSLVHELLHALSDLGDLRDMDSVAEEERVVRMAPVLLQVIRENPKLLEYLTS
jgi:Zn-dependent peptidase ImmA (M78 family)